MVCAVACCCLTLGFCVFTTFDMWLGGFASSTVGGEVHGKGVVHNLLKQFSAVTAEPSENPITTTCRK